MLAVTWLITGSYRIYQLLLRWSIWDWVDQAMYNYTKDGKRYLAYGGDFGDTPNDGQFVMNGIVFADLEPKPQYFETKKVYQHIGVKLLMKSKAASKSSISTILKISRNMKSDGLCMKTAKKQKTVF